MARDRFPVVGTISDGTAVAIDEVELGFLTQLAGWDRFREAAGNALGSQSLSLPEDYRLPVRHATATVWRIAPDRVLVRSEAKLPLESSDELVILDLSEARVCLAIEGPGAAGLLSRVIALDFSESGFPTGAFAQTALHHVGVLVDRQGPDRFTVLIPTTWATSMAGLLAGHIAQGA